MQPTSELEKEHENIRRMLEVVREMIRRLEAEDPVEADDVQAAIDFIREYADRSHHAKEEDLLFPAMGEAGFPPEGGPVAVMLDEHDEGRAYVTSMEEGLQQYRGVRSPGPASWLREPKDTWACWTSTSRRRIRLYITWRTCGRSLTNLTTPRTTQQTYGGMS